MEVNLRKFKVITYPGVKYMPSVISEPGTVFISRTAFVTDFHTKICRQIAAQPTCKLSAEQILGYSRLWKFEGDDTLEDADQLVKKAGKELVKNLPLQI